MIIRVHTPKGTIQEFPLQAPKELRIGSHPSLEITLAGAGVSKLHGGIVFKEGKPCIVAAKPTEKITLNGKPVTRAVIKAGDRIRIGEFELEVCQPATAKAKTKSGPAPKAAPKQSDDLGLAPESDELGLAPEPGAKSAKSRKAPSAQIDDLELLDDTQQQSETEDLEVLDDFEELTETVDAGANTASNSLDVVDELDEVESLDDMEMLEEPAGNLAGGDSDWLQSGDLMAEAPAAAGDLFGDIANLPGAGMVAPGGMPGAAPTQAGAKQKAEKKPRVKKKRNFGPLKYIAVAVAAVGFLAAAIAASMLGPSAQDRFAAADQLYQNQQLSEAGQAFADFQQKYPRSIFTDEARVKRGLIKLLPLVDSQDDAQVRFATVQQVVQELGDLASHPMVQSQLANLLPPLAKGLSEEALALPVTAGLDKRSGALSQANQALQMTRQSLSPAEFTSQNLGDLEIRLLLLDREISETTDLELATAEIEKALENSGFDSGSEAYERLLDNHASLADSPILRNLMQRLSDGMAGQVVFSKEALPPPTEPKFKSLPTITLASRESVGDPGQSGQRFCIFDPQSAAVYCLNANYGALLWRKFIGFDAAFDPHSANGPQSDVILHNAATGAIEKLHSDTGEVLWSKPIGDKKIWLSSSQNSVYVSTADGEAWELDRASGDLKRKITYPEPLGFAAYIDEADGKLYQPAVGARLYSVALDRDSCDGASFVGNQAYSLRFPPAVLGDYLAVLEDAGLDRSALKLMSKKGRSQLIQSLPLDARVVGGPLAEQKLLLLPTDDSRLLVFGMDDKNSSQPLSLKSEVKWADTALPIGQTVWLTSAGGTVFQAGQGLQVFKRRAGSDEYILSNNLFSGMEMVQAAEVISGNIVVAYRERSGVTVEGLNSQDLTSVWKTRVACKLLAGNTLSLAPDSNVAMVLSADLARFQLTKPQLSTAQNLVVNMQTNISIVGSYEPQLISDGANSQIVAAAGHRGVFIFSSNNMGTVLRGRVRGKLAKTSVAAVFPLDDGRTILLDWKSGQIVGKPFIQNSPDNAAHWVSTCELGDDIFAAADSDGKLQVFRLNQTPALHIELLAEKKLEAQLAEEMVASGELLWVVSANRTLLGLDADSLEQKTAVDLNGSLMFGPRLVGEYLVLATDRQIICVSASSGEQVWQQPLAGKRIVDAAAGVGERLILASAAGEIWAIDLKTGDSRSNSIETGQSLRSIYAVGEETVYLQTADGSLLLLKLAELSSKE